jgi:hypothetical protein
MSPRKILEYGGYISGALLVVFGVIAIYMGVDGRSTVQDSLKQEQIYFGAVDDPAVAKYASEWAAQEGEEQGSQVATGEQARAFAQIIRTHAFEGSENLTYSQIRSQGRGRPARPERGTEHVGHRDGAHDRAEHVLHG